MRKYSYLFILVGIPLLFFGCHEENANKAHLISSTNPVLHTTRQPSPTDEKIRLLQAQTEAKAKLAKIEAQRDIETAKIKAKTEQTIKEIELKQTQSTNAANTQIASTNAKVTIATEKERQKAALVQQHEKIAFYRLLLIVGAILLLMLLVFIYFLYKQRQNLKLKIHEEDLRHRAYLEASRQSHEKVTKVLDIIAREDIDKGVKKELTRLLKEQEKGTMQLLE